VGWFLKVPDLDFDVLSVPQGIKNALKALSARHEIKKFDPKGSVGYTFFGRNCVLSTEVAIKFYYWGGDPKFHAEPQALTKIQSPNILSVHDAGYADGDYAYFVTPYCSGGDLDDLLGKSALVSYHPTLGRFCVESQRGKNPIKSMPE